MAEDWVLVQNQTIAEDLEETNVDLITSLRVLLSNTVTVYHRAQGYHWNVKGLNFAQYHEFFEDIYKDIYDSIDPTAEWLRKLHEDALCGLSDFIKNRTIQDPIIMPVNAVQMLKDLYNAIEALDESTEECLKIATMEDEQGLINFLAGRLDMLEKWEWQLEATFSEVL